MGLENREWVQDPPAPGAVSPRPESLGALMGPARGVGAGRRHLQEVALCLGMKAELS